MHYTYTPVGSHFSKPLYTGGCIVWMAAYFLANKNVHCYTVVEMGGRSGTPMVLRSKYSNKAVSREQSH